MTRSGRNTTSNCADAVELNVEDGEIESFNSDININVPQPEVQEENHKQNLAPIVAAPTQTVETMEKRTTFTVPVQMKKQRRRGRLWCQLFQHNKIEGN